MRPPAAVRVILSVRNQVDLLTIVATTMVTRLACFLIQNLTLVPGGPRHRLLWSDTSTFERSQRTYLWLDYAPVHGS